MRDLRGRHVLLTGASRGIGAYVARALAGRGARLTLVARSKDELEAVAAEVRGLGAEAVALSADLARREELARLVEAAERGAGPVDVLVNNAGIEIAGHYAALDEEAIVKLLDVNLRAPMLLTRKVLPGMLARRWGHVCNVSSLAGKVGTPFNEPYSASKFGLSGFTESMRITYAGSGVGFSSVCPGFVREAGMHARTVATGVVEPRLVGATTPEAVARAMLRAIEGDVPEILVTPGPMRPLLAASALSPRLTDWAARVMGVRDFFARTVAARS